MNQTKEVKYRAFSYINTDLKFNQNKKRHARKIEVRILEKVKCRKAESSEHRKVNNHVVFTIPISQLRPIVLCN